MKLIASILSVYILSLIAVPCIDAETSCMHEKTSCSQDATDNHQNDIDHCSPFCTCDCCITLAIHQIQILPQRYCAFAQKQSTTYHSTYSSSLYASIWQPPKLS